MNTNSTMIPTPTPLALILSLVTVRMFPGWKDREPNRPEFDTWYIKNAKWTSAMLKLIMREVFEVYTPITYSQFKKEVKNLQSLAPDPTDSIISSISTFLDEIPSIFGDIQQTFILLDSLPESYVEREDDGPSGNQRVLATSPLGTHLRKSFLGYKVLRFEEAVELGGRVVSWCDDAEVGASGDVDMDGAGGGKGKGKAKDGSGKMSINKLGEIDDTIDSRLSALQQYQAALDKGDYSLALSSMTRFYDYRFPGYERGLHQHALLNLGAFHYSTGGLETAKQSIDEAIKVARAVGDKQCLKHCLSLSKRIKAESKPPLTSILAMGQPPHLGDVGEDLKSETPLDELWGIKQRLDLGESLPTAYSRIWRAQARQDAIIQSLLSDPPKPPIDQANPPPVPAQREGMDIPEGGLIDDTLGHAVQVGLWGMFGSNALVELHEEAALQCPMGLKDVELTLLISRSQRLCRQSRCDEALSLLIEPSLTNHMSLADTHKWSDAVWEVLEIDATRRADSASLSIINNSRLPVSSYRQLGAGGPRRVQAHPGHVSQDYFRRDENKRARAGCDRLCGLLDDAEVAEIQGLSPQLSLTPLLHAIQLSSKLGLWDTWRTATVRLGNVLGRMEGNLNPMRHKDDPRGEEVTLLHSAVNEVKPVWEQVLAAEDDDLISTVSWILARGEAKTNPAKGIIYAWRGLESAHKMKSRLQILRLTQLLAILHNAIGSSERDAFADRYFEARDRIEVYLARYCTEGSLTLGVDVVMKVKEIVVHVGVRAASGWV